MPGVKFRKRTLKNNHNMYIRRVGPGPSSDAVRRRNREAADSFRRAARDCANVRRAANHGDAPKNKKQKVRKKLRRVCQGEAGTYGCMGCPAKSGSPRCREFRKHFRQTIRFVPKSTKLDTLDPEFPKTLKAYRKRVLEVLDSYESSRTRTRLR